MLQHHGAFLGRIARCTKERPRAGVFGQSRVRPVVEEIRQEVDRFYEIARASVSTVWSSVQALAKALLVHEELDREGIDEAIGEADIYLPVFAVQRAHGFLQKSAPVVRPGIASE